MGGLLDFLTGERLEKTQKNMEALIEGTSNLIAQMKELVKALQAHERTMKELRDAIEESR